MKNVGTIDRVVRILIGAALFWGAYDCVGACDMKPLGIISTVVGAVLILTAVFGVCPAYKICGMKTCKVKTG